VTRDEQFGAIKTLLDLGVIRNVGLSEVPAPEIGNGIQGV
jgi:pyridoxine 4-dehydrogenase